jgi:hypothetical protein
LDNGYSQFINLSKKPKEKYWDCNIKPPFVAI